MLQLTRRILPAAAVAAASATLVAARAPVARPALPTDDDGMHVGAVKLESAGVMHFGPDGTLFLADPRGAAVYAIDVADMSSNTDTTGVEVQDVDVKIAAALGTTRDRIHIHDMLVHPRSQNLYFSLTRGRGGDEVPLLVTLAKKDQAVAVVPLERIRHARTEIAKPPAPDAKTRWGAPKRLMSVTDLALVDGELYVAGLSNEEFSSTLRRIPYPFGRPAAATSVEIYHTSHDRYETASPIETFLPITLGGRPSLVAGYGCSPIATFSRADLATKSHLRGKTVAELGGGNRPLDMISYSTGGKEFILIANSDRTLTRLDAAEVAAARPLTTAVSQPFEPAGVKYLPIAIVGVLQLDNLNAANVVVLKRDIEDGSLDVVSVSRQWI